jgi:AraC family transcriptional regulator
MLTDALPTKVMSSHETRHSHLPQAIVPNPIERRVHPPERDGRNARYHARLPLDAVDPVVRITPADAVKRRAATCPGMRAEIVQATGHVRIEAGFHAPVHLLVVSERGIRRHGETQIEGLPTSSLRDCRRKLTFVPAGHRYRDWQEPRVLSRVTYVTIDPARLPVNPELGFAGMSLAPRLFFENAAIWDTALKLTALIERNGPDNRLYLEALGIMLAHELGRLEAGAPHAGPVARGGLAAWQQRVVAAYIDEHFAEPISLAALAQLVRLSPFYFCRAFKQSFGVTPHRYHTGRRIERAKALLAKPSPSVTDIGFTVGFSQTSSFTAAFHKATGLTPTAYHRSLV